MFWVLHDQLSARELQQKPGDGKHCLNGGHRTCNCPKDSRYLSIVVVFLKVPKNGLMKEEGERNELSEAKLKSAEKIKVGLNTATSYFFPL